MARPHIILASSMVILVVISYTILRLILPDQQADKPDNFQTELAEYLAGELDEKTISESIETSSLDLSTDDIPYINVSEEDIINYLIEESINYEEIFDNL